QIPGRKSRELTRLMSLHPYMYSFLFMLYTFSSYIPYRQMKVNSKEAKAKNQTHFRCLAEGNAKSEVRVNDPLLFIHSVHGIACLMPRRRVHRPFLEIRLF